MSKLEVELNRSGVRELLQSSEVEELCRGYANDIAHRANGAYEVSTQVGRNRVNASVYTEDSATINDNLKNNTLLKAVGR